MEVIPVIDILHGKAVHAVGGQRSRYAPLRSVFSPGSSPLDIAMNMPFERVYIADLDAITGGEPNLRAIREISREKEVLLDAGIRVGRELEKYRYVDITPVLGTETLESLSTLRKAGGIFGEFFASIDIKAGRVLSPFLPPSPGRCFEVLHGEGCKNIIFLELSEVGSLSSPSFSYLKDSCDRAKVYVGGGVKPEDIEKLERRGVCGVLMGTALHSGMLGVG